MINKGQLFGLNETSEKQIIDKIIEVIQKTTTNFT